MPAAAYRASGGSYLQRSLARRRAQRPRLRERIGGAMQAMFGQVSSVSDPNHWIVRAIGGGKTKAGVPVSEFTAVNMPAVWACVTLIADSLAQMPVDVIRKQGDRREPQEGHPVGALLNGEANDEMVAAVVSGTTAMHALLWGNGYQEIGRNGRGEAVELWPLLPDRTWPEVRYLETGRRLRYRTVINQRSEVLPPSRVLHLMGQSYDGICGLSPVTIARNAIGLGLAMEEFGSKFFLNDARSGGFLQHPGKLGDKAVRNIQASMSGEEGGQGGLENAFRVKVLEEGMKYVSTTIPPEDAQFLGSREFQLSEIARMYRVPLVLLQALQGSTVWGTGIEQLMIGFVTYTLGPWLRRLEQELTRKLLTPVERAAGFIIKLNERALLRGDMTARAGFYTSLYNIGATNPNEIRANEDLNPYDGGERFRVPLNMEDPQDGPGSTAGAGEGANDAA